MPELSELQPASAIEHASQSRSIMSHVPSLGASMRQAAATYGNRTKFQAYGETKDFGERIGRDETKRNISLTKHFVPLAPLVLVFTRPACSSAYLIAYYCSRFSPLSAPGTAGHGGIVVVENQHVGCFCRLRLLPVMGLIPSKPSPGPPPWTQY